MVINVKDDGSKSALAVWFPDYTTHRDFSNALSTATDAATHGTDPDPDSDTDNGDTVPSLLQRLPTVDQYNDLGLLRSFSRTSNTRQLQQQLLVTASQAVRGRTVKTGLSTVSARLALTVYKSILLPALTYGLQLWCLSPKDVPAKVSQLHHSNIITLVGRGPHTSVSKTCLFAALGVVPVWAYGLSLATGHVARVLSLPMRHPLRLAFATAATDAVDAIRTSGGDHQHVQRCWWTHVASLLSLGLDHSEDFSFIYDDLIKSLSPPLVKLTLAASSTTIAVPCPPLHSPPTQEWTVHFPRSKEYLKQVVCRIVLNHWRNVWSPAQRVMTNVYFPKHTSSGSSFEETVEWLSCAVPWTPFPLVSGRRNASFKLRIAALGGLGCVIDNRNLAFLRTLTVCPLCDCDDGFRARPTVDGAQCITLRHLILHCQEPTITQLREDATERLQDLTSLRARHTSDREKLLLHVFQDLLKLLPSVMLFLTLGVPIPPSPPPPLSSSSSSSSSSVVVAPTPRHARTTTTLTQSMRDLWYGRYAEGAKKRVSKSIQAHAMEATDELLRGALEKLQRAVWAMPGVRMVPQHEKQRRKDVQRETKEAAKRARQEKFRSYFVVAP